VRKTPILSQLCGSRVRRVRNEPAIMGRRAVVGSLSDNGSRWTLVLAQH
jgi:hypothetical protein